MAGINETFKEGGIVTKNDMRSVFWRSFPLQASFNYERMQNVGFCYSLLPVLKRLYPEKKEASEALKRHLSFFNTTPQLVTFITGACIAMEEENKKSGDQFDIESIAALKAALMGPIAGIGDSFFWGTFRIIAAGIGCGLAAQGSILGAILFLLVILVLLIAAIVPSVVSSVTGLVEALPGNVESLIRMVKSGKLGAYGVTDTISDMLTKLTDYVENWATKDLLPQMQQYLLQITSGVITMVKSILNFIIGIIVVVYVLSIKESLVGQSKKIVYAIFKPKHGNIIIEVFHKADEVFGGFIIGKIIDSAIIGVICYFGCLILHIPDTILVAVIIGVTNVIPVFGPFIGAIPSLLLVVIQSPLHALYLLIFIIILQQVDGNIIGPKILGDSTGLSAFWVMFSILIGGGLFGFLGMLLGVPVFAMIYYIIRRLVNHSIRKKNLTTVTEAYVEAAGVNEATGAIIYYGEKQKKKRTLKDSGKKDETKKNQ